MKKNRKTKAQLKHEISVLKGSLASSYHFASASIHKASTDHLMASGCLLSLHFINGDQVIEPVFIKDGLSDSTINAIKADLKRSYELSVMFKPE